MSHLTLFTIYDHPKDYPNSWVVRRSYVPPPGEDGDGDGFEPIHDLHPWSLKATLDEARDSIPPGLAVVDRHPGDDPVIKEVWL